MNAIINNLLRFIQKNLFVILIVSGLTALGAIINKLVNWNYLTQSFIILRQTAGYIDFIWDTETMFTVIGLSLSLLSAFYTFKIILLLRKLYND